MFVGAALAAARDSRQTLRLSPDYIWKEKMWELKTKQSEKGEDNAVRKAYKQIAQNPGGLFLDYGDNEISVELLNQIIHKRAMRYKDLRMDIMVINKGDVIEILRYKN